MIFTLDQVTKSFGGDPVLRDFGIEVAEGATMVLIGLSGCGKSTLIRLMLGLTAVDRGTITFEGEVITPENASMLRRRMGYVIQGGGLFPHLTARGNASLMAGYLGWSRDKIETRLDELVPLTRFPADLLDRYPVQLSGGQRQRVSLMRALMLDPDVLFLDEPFGALDPMVRHQLQTDLRDVFKDLGKTVIMVTHDIGEAGYLGDDIVLLNGGRIEQRGTIGDLVSRPATDFVSDFINAQRTVIDLVGGGDPAS